MSARQYAEAGVDLDTAEDAKARIGRLVAGTRTALSLGEVGAFGGMVRLPAGMRRPVLVMSTDGVGTKVLVALEAGRLDSVGEDLVNHSVNDILVHGARPIAFQDYVAGSALTAERIAAVVEGVARGCRHHQMALTGGETAMMPGLYQTGHLDLAGTILGAVEEDEAIHGHRIVPGDILLGYASSGLHTNGYTLARRIIFQTAGLQLDAPLGDTGRSVVDHLLAVHLSYSAAVIPVISRVHGIAHITGGGDPREPGAGLAGRVRGGGRGRELDPSAALSVPAGCWRGLTRGDAGGLQSRRGAHRGPSPGGGAGRAGRCHGRGE